MAASDRQLLEEMRFQLTVTRAMLGTAELDQILYIILSGITHGEGLNFNRACLFLGEPERRKLRAANAVGPVTGAEAERIWNEIEAKHMDLENLLASYHAAANDPRANTLTRRLAHICVDLDLRQPELASLGGRVDVDTLVAHCATTQEPFCSNTMRAVASAAPDDVGTEELIFHPVACVPLVRQGRVLGVVLADNAFNRRPIENRDMQGLMTLCNLAAISVDQAHVHSRLRDFAEQDGLTGLLNRRLYEDRKAREVARAQRSGLSLAMIVIDIDHFKQCNDQHGHEIGDQVLRDLAAIFRRRLRREDLVARYGGEEFVVLLAGGIGRGEAFRIAEELRRDVERSSLGNLPIGEITVSAGVVSLPADRLGSTPIFKLADDALYAAKGEGRNRVVISEVL